MKKLIMLSVLFILASCNLCIAQITGISTDKLASINGTTLPEGRMELEPTFSYFRSLGYYNQEGAYQDYSGVIINSALTLRATYGINEIWEVGANVSTQFNLLNLGTKFFLLGNEKFGLALIAGIKSDISNGQRLLSELQSQYVFGIGTHYHFTEMISINTSIQFQDSRNYIGNDLFINSEVGYYISNQLMLIAGLGYTRYSNSEFTNSSLFSLYPGFNFEKKMFTISLQSQFDLAGKNINSYNGISVSILQLLN